MSEDPTDRPATTQPPLTQELLARILGLQPDASPSQIASQLPRLLDRLKERIEDASPAQAHALRREIAHLETGLSALLAGAASKSAAGAAAGPYRFGALAGALFALVILLAYAAGFRLVGPGGEEAATIPSAEGWLVLEGRLGEATLRVFDADREELLLKIPAENARVGLAEGRYALEVHREDCPDHWTRSVYFEPDQTHRFEPTLCKGEGRLVVRSNVTRDRLKVDGLDLGPTGEKPHALGVGDHQVRVEKNGYAPFDAQVRIRPDETLELRADLVEAGAAAPVGRPMPVEKRRPASAPASTIGPERLDLSSLREGIGVDAQAIGLPKPDLPLDDFLTQASTGGGSTAWHDRVSADLLARYDADRSGAIDRLEESEQVSCEVWRDIERDFDGGGLGLTMVRYYGFDGSEWHPRALGFAKSHRSAVFEQMKECGLRVEN